MKTNKSIVAAWAIGAAVFGGGCIVEHDYPVGTTVVAEAPPPPQVEVVPVAPGPDFIWIGGYWGWHGRWVWEGGHYAHRPHAAAIWVEPRWEHGRRGWVRREGHWR